MEKWKNSKIYKKFINFILELNEDIKGKSLKVECYVSPVIYNINFF